MYLNVVDPNLDHKEDHHECDRQINQADDLLASRFASLRCGTDRRTYDRSPEQECFGEPRSSERTLGPLLPELDDASSSSSEARSSSTRRQLRACAQRIGRKPA